MRKFVNETISGKEKAIKVGNNVPSGSIGLSWFSSHEVTPSNTIGVIDYSSLIKENKISEKSYGMSQIAYADELGVLRKANGSYNFQSNDISISDLPLSRQISTVEMNAANVDSSDYVHYKYVSRYFISAPNSFSISNENSFVSPEYYSNLSIKVVDKNGFEYIDESLNRKKYRILLEPFRTQENYLRSEVPYRVVVYLDSSIPDSLTLVYDKVESNESGSMFNLELSYSESINPVPLYQELPEESFVIDRTTTGNKVFSVKKLDNKYSEIVNNSVSENGYQVIVPLKAFSDYRTYEGFNWRVVARLNSSVSLANSTGDTNQIKRKTLNVGVLYSSNSGATNSDINPYVFRRLAASPFNLFGYIFENAAAPDGLNKNNADYWKVDIDDLSVDIRQYDVLAWSPSSDITINQAMRIKGFLEKSKTLLLDLSNSSLSDNAAAYLEGNLNRQSTAIETEELRIEASAVTDYQRNGAWDLVSGTDYVSSYYGVWGSLNIGTASSVQYASYKPFANSSGSFLNIVEDPNSTTPSVARVIPYLNDSDSVSRGNIIATTFNLMNYCNKIHGESIGLSVVDNNISSSIYSNSDQRYSAVVEGPFKLLFNICAYALYSSTKSSRVIDERSAIYNYVSTWYPSWTMNQDVLLDGEKLSIFSNVSQNTSDSKYARDLIPQFDNMKEFIKSEFSNLSRNLSDRLNSDIDNIEIFIEVTNPSVDIVNSVRVTETQKVSQDLPSSYSLFRILDNEAKAYAETTTYSMSLSIPSTYGDYIIVDKPANYSKDVVLKDNLNVMDSLASYPFDLECRYSFGVPGEEKYTYYKASIDVDYSLDIQGTLYSPNWSDPEETPAPELDDVDAPSGFGRNVESTIDNGAQNQNPSIHNENNIYPYTGDLDGGNENKTSGWRSGNYGSYATYVQWVLKQANSSYYPYNLDNHYGPATAAGVRSFQRDQNERYVDGVVDSETKWYLAKFLQDNSIDISPLRSISEDAYNFARAAKATVRANQIEGQKDYRKITFTGIEGPQFGQDTLFFTISPVPNSQITKMVIDAVNGWDNFEIVEAGLASTKNTDINNTSVNYTQIGKATKNGNKFEINISGVSPSNAAAGYIRVKGGKLGGAYGSYAEGFGIKGIKIKGKNDGGFGPPGIKPAKFIDFDDKLTDITLDIDIRDALINERISAERSSKFDITNNDQAVGILSIDKSKATVVKLTHNGQDYALGNTLDYYGQNGIRINLSQDPQEDGYVEVEGNLLGNLSSSIDTSSIQYALNKVYSATDYTLIWSSGDPSSGNPLSAVKTGTEFEISTSSVYFSNSYYATATASQSLSSGYTLRSADVSAIVYSDERKNVNINDGVLLFCDSQGRKYGFPTYSEVQSAIAGQGSLSEVDARLGTLIVNNSIESPGLIYGFYDLNQNEFLGRKIDYIDMLDPERNIYIAVAAIDADGDLYSDNEFIGSSGSITFRPVRIPLKYVAPVYSVVMNQPSAIKIAPIDANLSRFDTWSLPITKGYFEKKIDINGSFENSNWKNNYRGQQLIGIYSTSSLSENNSAKIYGINNLDIYNEAPIILDDKTIKLRRTPVLAWNHPTNYDSSIFGIVKPVVKVEKRDSVNSSWQEVPYSEIRDINCQSGVISFTRRIVPGEASLIRVSYTISSKNAFVKRVGSSPVPLNPVLDQDLISFNQPLFVYLMPKELYSHSASGTNVGVRQKVQEYSYTSVVNYTYDSDLFNKNSSKYEPLALLLAAVYVSDKPENIPPKTMDIRLRGGGVVQDVDVNRLINDIPEVLYNWDVYSADMEAYARGGYVIIRMPESVKENFVDETEIYNIVKNNLTAGIVFELQDMNGNPWS